MVVLVGMMGSGKSVLGMALAEALEVPFIDTDRLFEARLGKPISLWFEQYGEASFREHETLTLQSLEPEPAVLSTGGGIVLREENWAEMRRLGTVVYLDVPPAAIKERLRTSKRRRPLLMHEDWEDRFDKIYAERKPVYSRADIVVRLDFKDIGSAVEELIGELCKRWQEA
jgi:shikimate kinase